ncbi:hypothetical protein [Thalassoporum mexicanum]|nr:hypothetical protein [Pseudanabaena sp. PCC 7367]
MNQTALAPIVANQAKRSIGMRAKLGLKKITQAAIAVAVLTAFSGWPGIASSQNMFSPIAPRFSPDPITYAGKASGAMQLQAIAGSNAVGDCQGLTQSKPNHVLQLINPFGQLSIKAEGISKNISLLVKGPDGVFCQTGRSPEISGAWALGEYQIWIASIDGSATDYRLSISETNH